MLTYNKSIFLLCYLLWIGCFTSFSQNTIPGKFAPINGKTMVIIGQDLGSVAGYVNSSRFPTPAGVTMYTDVYTMAGLNSITNYGAGDIGSQAALDQYPNSALAIGLWMVEENDGQGEDHPNGLTEIVNGQHNDELDKFAAFAKRNSPRPIYLRIGYEFDGPWNNYDPNKYKAAYKHIVDYLNQKQVTNVAYVWQSATWGATPANAIDSYYPGDQYVDYVGLSFFFLDANFNGNNLDYILNFARGKNKPIMMAEVSAQYHEFDQGTFHPFDNPGAPQQLGGQGIWNQFFRDQLIPFVDDNRDVIRAVAYINADWQSQPQWKWPDANNGFWGDTRIETNNTIATNWSNYINNGNFLHGGPNLLSDLGITGGPTPTCNDGIQNGDETGVDCGGSCQPCQTTPTCNDGVQNGDETGVDCGGSCAPCNTGGGNVTTKIEAETGNLSGQAQYYNDGAASSGSGVAYLDGTGNGFTISNAPKADKVELIYASQNSGKISILVDGQDKGDLNFTSNGAWVGSYATATLNVVVPAGASFKVVNNSGDVALNVDYLNFISENNGGGNEPCTGSDIPNATVSKTNESSQGANDGSITFSFTNNPDRTNIEFSINGGSSYPYNVPDNSGSTTVSNLSPGTYQVYTRWGNNECPQNLGAVTIAAGNGGGGTDCSGNCPDGFTFFACGRCWVDEAQAQSAGCNETCNDPGGPTCDDGIQNGDETGVDCGGSCPNECDTGGGCSDCINFDQTGTSSFSNQDTAANITIQDSGTTALLTDNTWRRTNTKYNITANTVLEFEFQSTQQGEIHGIGFDSNESLTSSQIFQLYGTQNWGNRDFDYTPSGYTTFSIPIGDFYTGDDMYLVLVNDFDNGSGNTSSFKNVRIFENVDTPTCSDGIQNGNETGIDCGGSCEPCSVDPTCDDGIQNGSETGVDCGGDCQPCNTSGLSAKLLPPNDKILLTIGQDLKTVKDYNDGGVQSKGFPEMGGTTTYISFYSILDSQFPQYGALGETANGGIATNGNGSTIDVDWGAGPLNARSSILAYPNSSLSIGLSMTEGEATADGINYWCQGCLAQVGQGQWDNQIKRLASFAKRYSDRAIYLRIAYEFDGNWNVGYENRSNYINAYKRVVDVMRAEGVTNVAYVWQSSSSPIDDVLDIQFGEGNFGDIESWYPGDNYVDWMGLSWFVTPDETTSVLPGIPTQREKANEVVSFARRKNKPVYIAESTPQGYDLINLGDCNISSVWDGTAAQGCVNKSASGLWNEWFTPFFEYIYANSDVIRQVHYINANWEDDTALFGQGNRANGYWGRAGVHINSTIANNWKTEIDKPIWLHGSTTLNSQLLQSQLLSNNQLSKKDGFSMSIYPNPSDGLFFVQTKNIRKIAIRDLNGRIIKTIVTKPSDQEIKIDLTTVERGMYLITTFNTNKTQTTNRLIIN